MGPYATAAKEVFWSDKSLSSTELDKLHSQEHEVEERLLARGVEGSNLKNVMSAWKKLQAGTGAVSKPDGGAMGWTFAVGKRVTLGSDLKQMHAHVRKELPRKDLKKIQKGLQDHKKQPLDTRKGWLIEHPLMWVNTIKEDILAGRGTDYRAPGMHGKRKTSSSAGAPAKSSKKQTTAKATNVADPESRAVSPSLRPARLEDMLSRECLVEGRDPKLYTPPGAVFQQARFAGMCQPLRTYLIQRKLFRKQGADHWDAIREWTKTRQGREYLRDCDLDPESVHLDHIHDKNHTPIHHACNCYFMPGGANSHFGDRFNDEKKRYIGRQATAISGAFVKWYIKAANALTIDCSKFKFQDVLF